MQRAFLFLIVGVLAVVAVVYAVRHSQTTSNTAVTALLPRETVAFAHLPDFNAARKDWLRSGIYQLYTEPTVQEFLRKTPGQKNTASNSLSEFEQLDPKDAFVALTSIANNTPKLVAGFRYAGSQSAAEAIIGRWRANLLGESDATKGEPQDYEQHKIDIYTRGPFTIASAYDGRWFFAANDLAELKAVIDRADGRVKDRQSLLSADESFRAAMAEMPSRYALCFFLQPKTFAANLSPEHRAALESVGAVCATTRFDNGEIHDALFVAMPKAQSVATLTRASAALGTKDTFLYVASLLDFSKQVALLDASSGIGGGSFLGSALQKMGTVLERAQITSDQWNAAFAGEGGVLADWATNAHWPSAVATFPVKDFARAKNMAGVIAHASDEDAVWQESDRNGVHYFSVAAASGFLVMRPTIAVSERAMIVGLDPGSVQAAVERSGSAASDFSNGSNYKAASASMPAPTHFFAFVDLALLYARIDSTLRPLLLMGAAFVPDVNDHVDLSKVPPAEIVTKHLAPIVSSQIYRNGGYLTESVGPITLSHSGIALVALIALGGDSANLTNTLGSLASPPLMISPSATATATPAGTP
ncbi:MAG: hypothetical protein ABJB69_09510 [Spartobacteria bacterium]